MLPCRSVARRVALLRRHGSVCIRVSHRRAFSSAVETGAASSTERVTRAELQDLDKFDIGKQAAAEDIDQEEEDEMYEDPRQQILDAALRHVHKDGWSMDALAAGANELGYPSVASGMFQKGAVELVWHVMRKANVHMSETLEQSDLASMRVNERVKAGVQARLSYFAPYNRTWAQAMALGLQPTALLETLTQLALASDEIWFWAGDRSTDLNWYSRRLLLMGVMAATETAMLVDRSPGHADTWEFLDRRLDDVTQFGKSVGDSLSILGSASGGLSNLASAGMELLRPWIVSDGPLQYTQKNGEGTPQAPGTAAPTGSPSPFGGLPLPDLRAAVSSILPQGPLPGASGAAGTGGGSSQTSNPLAAHAQAAASAAAAAASVAQAVVAQASSVAGRAGLPTPNPTQVFSALSQLGAHMLPGQQQRERSSASMGQADQHQSRIPGLVTGGGVGKGTGQASVASAPASSGSDPSKPVLV